MKRVILTTLAIGATLPMMAAKSDRPNVIVILTDDMSYGDIHCYGNTLVKTPNIDQFSQEALLMSNFHVSPTSAPSRAALTTGRSSNRVGVWHTVGGRSLLFEDETTLAELFKGAGYSTGMFGKWHLGDSYPFRPHDRGFDKAIYHGSGGIGQITDYWNNDYFDDTYSVNGEYQKFEGYCTDIFFDEAMKFIDQSKEEPFFCWIATNAPHAPLNCPKEYSDLYKDIKEMSQNQRRYYGMVTNIDDNFAKLRKRLAELKLDKNTILIVMTDNGSTVGSKATFSTNGGFKGSKGSEFDGGHRVPFMIEWQRGNIGGGGRNNTLTSAVDLLPTLTSLCGITIEEGATKPLEGRDMTPLMRDKGEVSWADRALVVDSQRNPYLVKWRKSSVMTQRWRLVNGTALYDIEADHKQEHNLAKQHPDTVKMLREHYNAWWSQLLDEGVDTRYSYIKVGSDEENPVRITTHDQHTADISGFAQTAPLNAARPLGYFLVDVVKKGKYRISMARYPRESGYSFDSVVAAIPKSEERSNSMPASTSVNFVRAELSLSQYKMKQDVDMSSREVSFEMKLEAGRYGIESRFIDDKGLVYPSYFLYIERIN